MQHLTTGRSERFELTQSGFEAMADVMESVVQSPSARAEVRRALQLIVALRSTLDSPAAANLLAVVVANATGIRPHLEALSGGAQMRDTARAFLQQEGRSMPLVAPKVASPRDPKGLQVKDLLGAEGRSGRAGAASAASAAPTREASPKPKVRRGQLNVSDE